MALGTFWADVAVRNPLFQGGISQPDPPRIESQELHAALSKKNEWQFAGPIRGFVETDFEFLPDDKRQELAARVQEFNDLAAKLRSLVFRKPSDEGAVEEAEVANRARPPLRDIILLLEQDRYFTWEALRYGKLVESELGALPEGVVDLRFYVGKDSSGDPGFYAWAFIVQERTAPDEKLFALTRRVRPLIEDAMYRVAGGHFVYLSFRGVDETIPQDEDEEVAA